MQSELDDAKQLLQRVGYKVTAQEKRAAVLLLMDGKRHLANVTADLIAKREKKTYAVKVRSGQLADPLEPGTLRQLIEYDYVFKPSGLLFVDLSNREIHEIDLEVPRSLKDKFIFFLVILFIILAVIGIIAVMVRLRLI